MDTRSRIRHLADRLKLSGRRLASRLGYPKSFAISLFLFYLTTFGDSVAFRPAGDYTSNPFYYFIKSIILIIFVVFSQLIPYLYKQVRLGNQEVRRYLTYFAIYATVMLAVWLLVYPGAYTGFDEPYLLLGARTLDITFSWHHVLTLIWYALALGIFPSLAAITFVQLFGISAIVAYVVSQFHKLAGARRAQLLFFVFLLPSILIISLIPHRLSVYAFLELLLFFVILKTYLQQGGFGLRSIIVLGVLTGVVAAFRTESIIFLVLVPIVVALLFVRTKRVDWRKFIVYTATTTVCFGAIYLVQNLNATEKVEYQLTGIIEPLSSVVIGGNYEFEDKARAKVIINKAIDYDRLVAGENASVVYWSRPMTNFNNKDLSELKSLTAELILKNPVKFLKGSAKNFLKANGLWPTIPVIMQPSMNYENAENLIVSQPISDSIRNNTLNIFKAASYDRTHYTPAVRVLYNTLPVLLGVIGLALYMLWRKDILVLLLVPLILKNIVVFLAAPLPWFFYYYFPLQLTGLVLIVAYVLFLHSSSGRKYAKQLRSPK